MRAARTIAIAAVTGAFLLPLAWTGLAAIGVLPDDSMRPPSWTGPPTLDHIADIGVAEPTFWQELATSTLAAIVAAASLWPSHFRRPSRLRVLGTAAAGP